LKSKKNNNNNNCAIKAKVPKDICAKAKNFFHIYGEDKKRIEKKKEMKKIKIVGKCRRKNAQLRPKCQKIFVQRRKNSYTSMVKIR